MFMQEFIIDNQIAHLYSCELYLKNIKESLQVITAATLSSIIEKIYKIFLSFSLSHKLQYILKY